MKRIILIITVFSIVVISSKSFAHGQNTHKYMTYQAYQLLKRYFGAIPEMESHLGSVSNVYEDDYPFQTGDIIAGAYREDEEDLVFGYDGYLFDDLDIDVDDWIVSITHFWDADDGDNATNYFYATVPGISGNSHVSLGYFPNSYQKMLKFINPNRFWEIKFKMTPGSAQFALASGGHINIYHCGGVGIEYNSLIELYKTGKAWITGYYACPLADWQTCNYEVILGQGYRDALVWEILGRMCHLIEDISVPAHAHKDEHGYYPDAFEDYMSDAANYDIQVEDIPFLNPYLYQSSDPIHFLMYFVQQVADHFASDGEDQNGWGDDNLGGDGTAAERNYLNAFYPLSTLGKPNTPAEARSWAYNSNIRDVTYPLAIGAAAGLLYWFTEEADLEVIPPGINIVPAINNLGTVPHGSTPIYSSFDIVNNGGVPLVCIVKTTNPYYDFTPETSWQKDYEITIGISPGYSKTINYYGLTPLYAGPFTEVITIDALDYEVHETHTIIGTVPVPDFCFGETSENSYSPEEIEFDNAFRKWFFNLDSLSTAEYAKLSLKEKMSFAYEMLNVSEKEPVSNVCKMCIDKYPNTELAMSFYALNILWESSLNRETSKQFNLKDFKEYLKELTHRKQKYRVYGYAELILWLLERDKIVMLENLYNNYSDKQLSELSLFHQFIYYSKQRKNEVKTRSITKRFDEEYPDSKYAYQAHLILGDKGYNLSDLKDLMERNTNKYLAKKLNRIDFSKNVIPIDYELAQNFPNPFNPTTTISYSIPENTFVNLSIYNLMGQLVKTIVSENQSANTYSIEWDSINKNNIAVSSGIYFYTLRTSNKVITKKMVLLR